MLRFLLLITLLTPSLAYSFDGVFIMQGVHQRKYYPLTETRSVLYYTIKANQRIEHKNKYSFKQSYKKETAREVLEYLDGTLTFSNSQIQFQSAYYYQGVFYMVNVKGKLGDMSFSSREIAFNPFKHALQSNHVVVKNNNRIKIKKAFSRSTLPLAIGIEPKEGLE